MITDNELAQLSARTGDILSASNATLTTAESCTGGWLAKVITDTAGSSGWFASGFVTYSNPAKQHMLGVSPMLLERYGAVSESVVREMAQGALTVAPASYAIAISGIAGPDGGSVEKPVGTVWFAFASSSGQTFACCEQFPGEREAVRRQAVKFALHTFCQHLLQNT